MRTVADLKLGERATVFAFSDDDVSQRLMEMGCLPGCQIRLSQIAPLGCPLCLEVDHARLTIRREAAMQIVLA